MKAEMFGDKAHDLTRFILILTRIPAIVDALNTNAS
jgi:hypothetical protein